VANHTNTSIDHVARKKLGKNVLTTGELDPSIAGRKIKKLFDEIVARIIADQGGIENLTEMRIRMIRRFASSSCLAALQEEKLFAGKSVRLDEDSLITNSMDRVCRTVGINRRSKDITPTLKDYLDSRPAVIDDDGEKVINNIEEDIVDNEEAG
jgi:hypothetical protein